MAAKHMKLLLAALALLLVLAATFVHAECDAILFCETCSNPAWCDECKAGYSLGYSERNVCTSLCPVFGCEKCSTTKTEQCEKCLPGYNMSGDNRACLPMPCKIVQCAKCASETTCDTCADGFELSHMGQFCVAKMDYCFVPHCASCDNNRYLNCEQCSEGYWLGDNGTVCNGAMTPAGAAVGAIAAFVLAAAALAL